MSAYKPPADASVIDDSGLVSVYWLADGRLLFVDETFGTPLSSLGKLLKRLFFLTLFILLAGMPMSSVTSIPAVLPWCLNGTVLAVMAYLIVRYFEHIRLYGRWEKQYYLFYNPRSQQWSRNSNMWLSDRSSSALEVVSETYRDRYKSSHSASESQKMRTENYYLYMRTGNNTNHLLLRTITFKKAHAIALLLEEAGMPGLMARGFTPPVRD